MDVPGLGFTVSFDKSATTTTSKLSTRMTDLPFTTGLNALCSLLLSLNMIRSCLMWKFFSDHSDKDFVEEGDLSDSEVTEHH